MSCAKARVRTWRASLSAHRAAASLRVQCVQSQHAHRSGDRLQRRRDQGDAGDAQDLQRPTLRVTATCVRVPVLRAHCVSINFECEHRISPQRGARDHANAPGVKLVDDPERNYFPMPKDASGARRVTRRSHSTGRERSVESFDFPVRGGRSAAEGRGVECGADCGAVASDGLKRLSRVSWRSPRAGRDAGHLDSARLAARHDAGGRSLRGRALSLIGRARANSVPSSAPSLPWRCPLDRRRAVPPRSARHPHHAQRAVPVADPVISSQRGISNVRRMEIPRGARNDKEGERGSGVACPATPLGARAVMRGSSWSATSDGEPPGQRAAPGQRRLQAKAPCMHAHVPSTRVHGPQ